MAQGFHLRPSELPWARDGLLALIADAVAAYGTRAAGLPGVLGRVSRAGHGMDLMWVSEDMTALALHTARRERLPEVAWPASAGLVYLDGGFPLRGLSDRGAVLVYGLLWSPGPLGQVVPVTGSEELGRGYGAPLAPLPVMDGFSFRVLRAVMALAEVRSEESPAPADVRKVGVPGTGERSPASVRVVTVREHVESTGKRGGRHRSPAYRFIVSGFWRNQPYGEGRRLRKRIWVAPYVRGPADRPLVVRDTVRTLR